MDNNLTLQELYFSHKGYSSDKWNIYLDVYDRVFESFKNYPVRLLEIGVQNGGSLDIWGKFFDQAKIIVGCDINEKCNTLEYLHKPIKVIIGDINDLRTLKSIKSESTSYDIIIDDGSHTSSDIVTSFWRLFPLLELGGIYVIEDLHCSYWKEFEGGLHTPLSSMNFFKLLPDILNFEHWGTKQVRTDHVSHFLDNHCHDPEALLSEIHSIEFINSMCIIKKRPSSSNLLGVRHVVGNHQPIASNSHAHGTHIGVRSQDLPHTKPQEDLYNAQQYINSLLDKIKKLESKLNSPGKDHSPH